MNSYIRLLHTQKNMLIIMTLLNIGAAILILPIPILLNTIIDSILPTQNTRLLIQTTSIIITLLSAQSLITYITNRIHPKQRKKWFTQIKQNSYAHIQQFSDEQLCKHPSSDLVARLTKELDSIQALLPNGIAQIIKNILLSIGLFTIMITTSWKLTLLATTMVPLIGIVFALMSKKQHHIAQKNLEQKNTLIHTLQEKIEGQRDIILTHSIAYQHHNTSQIIQTSETLDSKLLIQKANMTLIFSILPIIGTTLLWGIGGYWTIQNTFTLGNIMAFAYAFNYILQPLQALFTHLLLIPSEWASIHRIFSIVPTHTPPAFPSGHINQAIKGDIQFHNVSFKYPHQEPLFTHLTFQLSPGTVSCITGSNGSGKSTLSALMTKLLTPSQGTITIDGHPLCHYQETRLRQSIALVPQTPYFFSDTIENNILMGRYIEPEKFHEICKITGIHEMVSHFPKGIQTPVSEKGRDLSGGQRQKLAIARALITDPNLLILDEPSNNLDRHTQEMIKSHILTPQKNKTILLISHHPEWIAQIPNIYEIHNKTMIKRRK